LANIEIELDDELQALLLLNSLSESLDTLVVTLSKFALVGKVIMNTVTDSLLNEEVGRKEIGISVRCETNFVDNQVEVKIMGEIKDMISLEGDLNLTLS